MASEVTVTENQADKRTDSGVRKGNNALTASDMGTNSGRRQTDPGICFHSVCVNSHTKNGCIIVAVNSRKKKTATPGGRELAQHRRSVREDYPHCRIFFASHQGVIRTTVNTMEILVPLLNGKPNVPGAVSEGSHQTAVHQPMITR